MFNFFKPKLTIATHNGRFHPDDVFAVAVLDMVFEKKYKIKVVRTRDMEIIKKADMVVDIGGEYEPDKGKFDHHQIGGADKRDNGIPYASFGLVWKKYGEMLCGGKEVADEIEKLLAEPTDAGDSGVEIVIKKYEGVHPYAVYDIMETFMPSWKENFSFDRVFGPAVVFAKKIIQREIVLHKDKLEAVALVENIYKNSDDKRLLVLPKHYSFGGYTKKFPELLFVVFPNVDGEWALKTIQDDPDTFVNRKNLPESWAGKGGQELEKITGVHGSIFCHPNLFVAKAKTKEAILKLAEIALNS